MVTLLLVLVDRDACFFRPRLFDLSDLDGRGVACGQVGCLGWNEASS
jgi:hypothetical protein